MSESSPVMRYRSFALPKRGHSREEYEDAFACDGSKERFAVADGASESIYAKEWATLLCEAFIADPIEVEQIPNWHSAARKQWLDATTQGEAPWYVEEKLRDGAYATFLGLSLDAVDADGVRRWRAWAVGDSCLFQIKGDSLTFSFPVTASVNFGTRPILIGSRQCVAIVPNLADGTLAAGDELLLMTDALAQWFLSQHEGGRAPWRKLLSLKETEFPEWVESQRASRQLKNDDVTLVVIESERD